jgi:hypothetical protein
VENVPHRTVRFLISDVVHPHPAQVLAQLFCNLILEGEVVADTTDGESPYLLVRVRGLTEAVIIPFDKTERGGSEAEVCGASTGS